MECQDFAQENVTYRQFEIQKRKKEEHEAPHSVRSIKLQFRLKASPRLSLYEYFLKLSKFLT